MFRTFFHFSTFNVGIVDYNVEAIEPVAKTLTSGSYSSKKFTFFLVKTSFVIFWTPCKYTITKILNICIGISFHYELDTVVRSISSGHSSRKSFRPYTTFRVILCTGCPMKRTQKGNLLALLTHKLVFSINTSHQTTTLLKHLTRRLELSPSHNMLASQQQPDALKIPYSLPPLSAAPLSIFVQPTNTQKYIRTGEVRDTTTTTRWNK